MKNTFIAAMFIFWGFVVAVVSAGYIVKQNRLAQESMQKTYIESIQQITDAFAKGKSSGTASIPVAVTTTPKPVVTTPGIIPKLVPVPVPTPTPTPTPKPTPAPTPAPAPKPAGLTMDTVALHSTQSDCWIVINGNIYSVASYIPMHPGGARRIANLCGGDATGGYNGQGHSSYSDSLLGSYLVGPLQ